MPVERQRQASTVWRARVEHRLAARMLDEINLHIGFDHRLIADELVRMREAHRRMAERDHAGLDVGLVERMDSRRHAGAAFAHRRPHRVLPAGSSTAAVRSLRLAETHHSSHSCASRADAADPPKKTRHAARQRLFSVGCCRSAANSANGCSRATGAERHNARRGTTARPTEGASSSTCSATGATSSTTCSAR